MIIQREKIKKLLDQRFLANTNENLSRPDKDPHTLPSGNIHTKKTTKSVVDFGRKLNNEDDKISKNEGDFQIQQYTAESENDLQNS